MIPHIKIKSILILLITISTFSCNKNANKTNHNLSVEKIKIKEDSVNRKVINHNRIEDVANIDRLNYLFEKVVPLSDSYICSSDKYDKLVFSISGDSIFIDGSYTDDVYKGLIKSELYFPQKYLYKLYKNILPKYFNLNLPDTLENIRNKRAYQKESKLNAFFQDAFFINNYMFFENEGCLYCYKKKEKNKNLVVLPISKEEISNSNYLILPQKSKINISGSVASGQYQIRKDILLLWFDGDIEKWYVATLINDKVYQKLLIGKSETVELKEGGGQDNYIDFFINEELKIKLEYSKGKDYKSRKIFKTANYYISNDKKIVQ
ncbi:hypothetical protein HNQ02_002842 [Flavobacterium sp. 7E]|uniref:hypothetical protein n=1 Tax=Flavobacterium sp. 7E TaxID=2735898 RepID=UPI00156DDC9F|nr:hypothetical protein [Flavobacterium sp. 7E]NRS89908.1 hypothetical protein [Flavobacterium sp. 7E]